jgi:hypothetical protein
VIGRQLIRLFPAERDRAVLVLLVIAPRREPTKVTT